MADIFISYADEDRASAEAVAKALRAGGWSVWWSGDLTVGAAYRREIRQQLQAAKCVLVLWSNTSIDSEWVIDEAEDGKARNVLVQAVLEPVQPPHGFRGRQWADLTAWEGDPQVIAFQRLARGIAQFASISVKEAAAPIRPPTASSMELDSAPVVEGYKFGVKHPGYQRIFICYRRDDVPNQASYFYERFTREFGSDSVFMDVGSIPVGSNFVDHIEQRLAECAVMVVMIGPEWATVTDGHGQRRLDDANDFVRIEIAAALSRRIPVIPVLIGKASMPHRDALPHDLRPLTRHNALEISNDRFKDDINRLVETIRGSLRTASSGL